MRDELHRQKKEAIMEKCFNCYAENGLTGTGIKALAKVCGCTSGNLYSYFKNLDDLIIESTAYCMSKVEDEFMAKAPTDPADIQRFIEEVPYWTAEKHGKKYRLMYQVYTLPKYIEHGKKFFEGVNEPRLRGEGNEWIGDAESREVVNQYAKAFVETVRASGGNNPNRCIMVTPYAASSTKQNMEALEVPQGDDKIIVSIHAYLPYSFALDTAGTDQYTSIDSSITTLFTDINEVFLSKGIPVIIGEFGSVNKANTEARVQCVKDYLSTAKQYGVPCCWWDNGTRIGNGENFGLLNRSEGGWYFPEIIDAIMETVNS